MGRYNCIAPQAQGCADACVSFHTADSDDAERSVASACGVTRSSANSPTRGVVQQDDRFRFAHAARRREPAHSGTGTCFRPVVCQTELQLNFRVLGSLIMKRVAILVLLLAPTLALGQPARRPMTIDDLFRFKRVSDPQISPDGKMVVYVVTTVDLAGNKIDRPRSGWSPADGKGEPRQLTNDRTRRTAIRAGAPTASRSSSSPTAPATTSSGSSTSAAARPQQLTTISTEAGNGIWSRDGKQIAFVSAVYPEFSDKPFKESDALNKKKHGRDREEPGQGEGLHEALLSATGTPTSRTSGSTCS